MLALIIILSILLLIALLPVGADGGYNVGDYWLLAKIGPLTIRILPRRKEKKRKKRKAPEFEKDEPPKKEKKKIGVNEILSLVKIGSKALGRLRRKLSVDYFRLHYTAASSDPFSAAMQFGYLSAVLGAITNTVENSFNIIDRDVDIKVDFDIDKPIISVRLTVTIQIWQIICIAAFFGVDYLKLRKKLRNQAKSEERTKENGTDSTD